MMFLGSKAGNPLSLAGQCHYRGGLQAGFAKANIRGERVAMESSSLSCLVLQHAEGRHEVELVGMNTGRLGNDAQHGVCHIVRRQHLCPVQVPTAFVP